MVSTSTTMLLAPVQEGLALVEARLGDVVIGQHPALTAATEHLLRAGGKRIRPAITLLAAGLLGADRDKSASLATAIELLHTATLVHDDLIDGSLLRRGVPTLNVDWSPEATVLTGDYLFARAASLVTQTDNTAIVKCFADTLMTIVNGEIRQKFSSPGSVDRQDYYQRIYAKTAALFVLCTRAASLLGEADGPTREALSAFGRHMGMAYQIVDDVLDFTGSPEMLGKPAGSDLRQGLFTLPAIYYVESHPDDPDVRALRSGNGQVHQAVPRLVAAVCTSEAIEEAMSEARELVLRGKAALANLAGSVYLESLLEIAHYIVDRTR